jgi:hypothetical protein
MNVRPRKVVREWLQIKTSLSEHCVDHKGAGLDEIKRNQQMKCPKMYSITGLRRCKVIIVARMYKVSSLASCAGFGKQKPEVKGGGFTFEVEDSGS